MKRMVVTCEDGSRHEAEIGDDDRLSFTERGLVRFDQAGFDEPVFSRLPSPAVAVDELRSVA